MDERPLAILIIAVADGVLGAIILLLGILCSGLVPLGVDLIDIIQQIIPYFLPNEQFAWVAVSFGFLLIVGALGLARMSSWGYFMVLLNRLLLATMSITYLTLQIPYLLLGVLVPAVIIVVYLLRVRGYFFEVELPPIEPPENEEEVPELPESLVMPSAKAVRAKEIQEVLSVPRQAPRTCPNCGGENPLDVTVCHHCGVPIETPSPRTTTSAEIRETPEGPPTFCIYCGTKNPTRAEYCFRCGKMMWKSKSSSDEESS